MTSYYSIIVYIFSLSIILLLLYYILVLLYSSILSRNRKRPDNIIFIRSRMIRSEIFDRLAAESSLIIIKPLLIQLHDFTQYLS